LAFTVILNIILVGLTYLSIKSKSLWPIIELSAYASINLPNKLPQSLTNIEKMNRQTDRTTAKKSQKCKIPVLDPYHPDIRPFIEHKTAPTCDYPQLTQVTDEGFLNVRDHSKVIEAKFAYMQRVDENRNKFTEWIKFYDKNDSTQNKSKYSFCLPYNDNKTLKS